MGRPTIRSATEADIDSILALLARADAAPSATDDAPSVERAVEVEAFLVAEADGEIVGSLVAAFDGWRGNLYRLAVDPHSRREGIASALVTEGERRLLEQGCVRITALVLHDEEPATGFWRAVGYVHDARVARYVKTAER